MINKNSLVIGRFGLITTLSFCALVTSYTALAATVKAVPVVHCAKNSYTCFLKTVNKKQSVTMSITKTVASVQVTETLSFAPSANGTFAFTTLITQERYVGKVPTKLTKAQIAATTARQKAMTAMKGYHETFTFSDLTRFTTILKNWQKGIFKASLVVDAEGHQTPIGDLYDFSSVTDSLHPLATLNTNLLGRVVVKTSGSVLGGHTLDLKATCPTGSVALAGGFTSDWDPSLNFPGSGTINPDVWFKISDLNSEPIGPRIQANEPTIDGKGWHVTFFNTTDALGPLNVTTQVVCGDPSTPGLVRPEGPGASMSGSLSASASCPVGALPLAGSYSNMLGVPVSFYPDHSNWQIFSINRDTTTGTAFPGAVCAAAAPVETASSAKPGSLLWQVVTSPETSIATQKVGSATAACPAGTTAIGGGYTFSQANPGSTALLLKEGTLISSAPTDQGWAVSMYNNWIPFSGPIDGQLKAYAVCVSDASTSAKFEVYPPLPVSLQLTPSTGAISGTPSTPFPRSPFTVVFPQAHSQPLTTNPLAGTTITNTTSTTTTGTVTSRHSLRGVSAISLSPTTLSTSQRAVLSATASYADGKTADVTLLCKWSTSDPQLAIVTDQKTFQTLSGTGPVSATCTYTEAGVTAKGTVQFTVQLDPSLQPMSGHPTQ